ncbi:MAG: hypothetical protein K6A80_09165 [Saccharofermentans sp.]|nr:hypothetical protein [Saccharofermentans sp.]
MGLFDKFKTGKKSGLVNPGTKTFKDYPHCESPFRQRVELCWKQFVKEESVLRGLIDAKAGPDQISEELHKLLSPAFARTYAEVGRNGDKYDLILNLEGDWAKLFSRAYFKSKAPKEVLEHWNIIVGRQSNGQAIDNFKIVMEEDSVCASDISLWTDWENGCVRISVYCEEMRPIIEGNINAAYNLLYILLDQTVGELAEMKYIADLRFIDQPLDRPVVSLKDLMDNFVSNLKMTKELLLDADRYIDLYSAYRMNPDPGSKDGTRGDIISGSTCFLPLMNDYYGDRSNIMDSLQEDGILAGFLFYPLDTVESDSRGTQILDLRDAITSELEQALPDSFMFVGGATGVNLGYIDFIAWDFRDILDKVPGIAEKHGLSWISFRSFKRDSESYTAV